jgi:hypothetical protein
MHDVIGLQFHCLTPPLAFFLDQEYHNKKSPPEPLIMFSISSTTTHIYIYYILLSVIGRKIVHLVI